MVKQNYYLEADGVNVPIAVHVEKRKSVRTSFNKSSVSIRIPAMLSYDEKNHHYQKAIAWIKKYIADNPKVLDHYRVKNYRDIDHIDIYDKTIRIKIIDTTNKTAKGIYDKQENTIIFSIPYGLTVEEEAGLIQPLLSRVCAQIFSRQIEERVREINEKHFKKEIAAVKLKYNKSNWGSCSTNKNVNLSTRLLFAPMDVIDYVIIHELAHLIEMNHSKNFWAIIEKIMPDYKEKEKWLKENGSTCDF